MFYRFIASSLLFSATVILANVQEITTLAQYEKFFADEKPLIVMYSGEHCGPCRATKPHFKKAASAHSTIRFCAIDANTSDEKLIDHMDDLSISGIPTLVFSYKGKILHRTTGGLSKTTLENAIAKFNELVAQKKEKETIKKDTSKKTAAPESKQKKS